MMKWLVATTCSLFLTGCKIFSPASPTEKWGGVVSSSMDSVGTCGSILGCLGGLCTLCGMALLVITRGQMGWRPLIGGIVFVVINYALAMYSSWFFLPVAIATGAVSLAWAGKIVWNIFKEKKLRS